MKKVRIGVVAAAVFAIVAATSVVVLGVVAIERRHSARKSEQFATVAGNADKGYECQSPKSISAAVAGAA